MAWGYWSATTVDRGRSPRRNTQCTPLPVNLVQQEEEPCIPTTATATATSSASTCPNTPSAPQQSNICYSPTCRSRCSSPCQSPCPGSPCGSITPPPPPHMTSSQQHLHQHSNKNCPAAQQILSLDDYPSRRQSLDRLDSPQVWIPIKVKKYRNYFICLISLSIFKLYILYVYSLCIFISIILIEFNENFDNLRFLCSCSCISSCAFCGFVAGGRVRFYV